MIRVTHYSDVLCIWAYIAQIRIDELVKEFPTEVNIHYRFMPVFGDVAGKLSAQWAERGGLEGYATHVRDVAEQFPHIELHPRIWLDNTPSSSLPAHLLLCAAKVAGNAAAVEPLLLAMRHAFFVENRDISQQSVLAELTRDSIPDGAAIQNAIDSGRAHAELAADIAQARDSSVKASPTLELNEGRQRLTGNVGYRVIEANIRELLAAPGDQQSWC